MMHERLQGLRSSGQHVITGAFSAIPRWANLWAISVLPSLEHSERQMDHSALDKACRDKRYQGFCLLDGVPAAQVFRYSIAASCGTLSKPQSLQLLACRTCVVSNSEMLADTGGLSSNGRAPASHAGGRGIDALSLHLFCF